jgi:hypothetical protein
VLESIIEKMLREKTPDDYKRGITAVHADLVKKGTRKWPPLTLKCERLMESLGWTGWIVLSEDREKLLLGKALKVRMAAVECVSHKSSLVLPVAGLPVAGPPVAGPPPTSVAMGPATPTPGGSLKSSDVVQERREGVLKKSSLRGAARSAAKSHSSALVSVLAKECTCNKWGEGIPFLVDHAGWECAVDNFVNGSVISHNFEVMKGGVLSKSRFTGVIVGMNENVDEEVELVVEYQLFEENDFQHSKLVVEAFDGLLWHQNYIVNAEYKVTNAESGKEVNHGDCHDQGKAGATADWRMRVTPLAGL